MARSIDSSAVPLTARLLREPRNGVGASSAAERGRERDRIVAIDAVRGAAMLFVGISHTRYYSGADPSFAMLLRWLGYLAAPAFLLVSGIACGYQFSKSASREIVLRVVDRGLFVLVVGHILVCGSLWYEVAGNVFQHIVITDTIGLCICLSPLVRHLSARRLVLEGIGLFLVTCFAASYWQPSTVPGKLIGALLFSINVDELRARGWVTPTLAYFAFFLIGMGVGKVIGESSVREEGRTRTLANRLLVTGVIAACVAVFANVIGHLGKSAMLHAIDAGEHWVSVLLSSTNARQQAPPSVAYALFYCGVTFAVLAALMRMLEHEPSRLVVAPARAAAVIGRSSFIAYVCIQWLVDFVPRWMGFGASLTPGTALLYLALVMGAVFLIAAVWDRARANRYLTFGLSAG